MNCMSLSICKRTSITDIGQNKEFYMNTDVRPPFTYASLIRQVRPQSLMAYTYISSLPI